MVRSLILILTSTILLSCQRYFEIQLPEHEPKFVINADLQVGRPVHVFVSQSLNVLQEGVFPDIQDATVELIEECGQSHFLRYKKEGIEAGMYSYTSNDLEIQPGKSYQLFVSKAGMPTATGKIAIPNPVNIDNVELSTSISDPLTGAVITNFSINFNDPIEENYYEIGVNYKGKIDYGWDEGPLVIESKVKLEAVNPFYQQEHLDGENLLLNDALFNGRKARVEVNGVVMPDLELEIIISLKSLSKEYYDYVNTLALQRFNSNNPFSQPVQVFGNIQNGYGILKGSSSHIYKIKYTAISK